MKIKIKTHFDDAKRQAQKQIDDANLTLRNLKTTLANRKELQSNHHQECSQNKGLLLNNQRAGLGPATQDKLEPKIKELEASIETLSSEIKEIEKSISELKVPTPPSFEREDLFISALENEFERKEVEVVEKPEDCFSCLSAITVVVDDFGQPTSCAVAFLRGLERSLTIKPSGKHYLNGFRPPALKWIPASFTSDKAADTKWSKLNYDHHNPNTVYLSERKTFPDGEQQPLYDKMSEKFILPNGVIRWITQKKVTERNYPYRETEEQTSHEDKFPEFAVSLGSVLDTLIEPAKDGLVLDDSYSAHPFLASVCSAIVAQTSPQPLFIPSSERLASPDVFKRIKADWEGFTTCPWASNVTGVIALLKNYVENGEKVRFWSEDFENLYGFRMRTRDHDWITERIYILTSIPTATSGTLLTVHVATDRYNSGNNPDVISRGRMFVSVTRSTS